MKSFFGQTLVLAKPVACVVALFSIQSASAASADLILHPVGPILTPILTPIVPPTGAGNGTCGFTCANPPANPNGPGVYTVEIEPPQSIQKSTGSNGEICVQVHGTNILLNTTETDIFCYPGASTPNAFVQQVLGMPVSLSFLQVSMNCTSGRTEYPGGGSYPVNVYIYDMNSSCKVTSVSMF